MEIKSNPIRQYVKLVLFALGCIELFLFLLALLFGREVGFAPAFIVCAGFGAIVIAVFLTIVLVNGMIIGIERLCRALEEKKRRQNGRSHDRE